MTWQRALLLAVLCWAGAGAGAYLLTQAMIFFPLRQRVAMRRRARVVELAGRIKEMPPDYPMRLRNRARTRYWLARVSVDLPYCNTCVSLWTHALAVVVWWFAVGSPDRLLGISEWLLLPGTVAVWWLMWLAFSDRLLPQGHSALRDDDDVERDPRDL